MSERLPSTKLALIGRRSWHEQGALRTAEPVAVIGLGCRFPGGVTDPDSLWELLAAGRDAVTEVPPDRWDLGEWYDADPATPGTLSTRWGGFLDDVKGFDAAFFDISPAEADRMDPQQRVALEVACEAIEHSGIPLTALRGTDTGVYFASYHSDYALLQYGDVESINARTLTGTLHSVLANRISYSLGLHGPSLAVDSACSSSLVAVHLACQALRTRDCDMALAGGVNLMITPHVTVALSKGGFMSPSGRCHTFDAAADGFVRGEGCAVVVLKRLADAIADDDEVLAVIRGSAVNQDGESTNLAAPNGLAQEALIRRALRNGGISPGEITLVEAHGTGTQLGDPIETDALAAVFKGRPREAGPCYLGSLKANLGHCEAAAGVGGLVKAVLCIRERTIPPQINFKSLNAHISLDGTPFEIVGQATAWQPGASPRVAAVSSFGVGGTNAHVVLEEPPPALFSRRVPPVGMFVLPLSARGPEALERLCRKYRQVLATEADAGPVCRGAARGRAHHRPYRIAATGDSTAALVASLAAVDNGRTASLLAADPPELCFVYSGQGTQWTGMGLALMDQEQVFRDAMRRIDERFRAMGGVSVIDELSLPAESSRLDRTDVAQVGIFSIQVALTELLRHWGVLPRMALGHSVGEIAAACAAGLLTLDEGAALVLERGRAMHEAAGDGRMLSVRASEAVVREILERRRIVVSLGAVNGPRSLVLSGPRDDVRAAQEALAAEGLECRPLDVRYSFHSPAMDAAARRIAAADLAISPRSPAIPLISTVDGRVVERLDADYVARNVRSTVRFAAAVAAAAERGARHFVEIGPHPVLGPDVAATVQEAASSDARITYALHGKRAPAATLSALLGTLYEWGVDPAWSAVYPGSYSVRGLPTYPWQHEAHWLGSRGAPRNGGGAPSSGRVAFPGRRLDSPALDGTVFELENDDEAVATLRDHRIGGTPTLPATAIAELFRTGAHAAGSPDAVVSGVTILVPSSIDAPGKLQLVVAREGGRADLFRRSDANPSWEPIARCEYGLEGHEDVAPVELRAEWAGSGVSVENFYEHLADVGCDFGPSFRLLEGLTVGDGRARGTVAAGALTPWRGPIHPAVVDACAQLCVAVLMSRRPESRGAYLPCAIDRYSVFGEASGPVEGRVHLRSDSTDGATFDVDVVGRDGRLAARIEGWHLRRAPTPALLQVTPWSESPLPPSSMRVRGHWIVAGLGPMMDALAGGLREAGAAYVKRGGLASLVHDWSAMPACDGVVYAVDASSPMDALAEGPSADPAAVDVLIDAETQCRHLLDWLEAVRSSQRPPPRLLVVTRGSQAPPPFAHRGQPTWGQILGLVRAVRAEIPETRASALDLDPAPRAISPDVEVAEVLRELANESVDAAEVAIRYGRRLAARPGLASLQPVRAPSGPVALVHEAPGTLDGFRCVSKDPASEPPPGHVLLRVTAAGVNFRDVLSSLGAVDRGGGMGQECCGEVVAIGRGVVSTSVDDRVIAFWPGCFATHVSVPESALWPAPPSLDPVEAAAVPVAFGTAWFALRHLAALGPGQSVLIHAAAGGVGMAAVQVARACGARVYGTAGTPEKRELLLRLGVHGAFDSRSASFEPDILAATGNRGVDVVLNSLTGNLIPAGIRCLAPGGLFVELGKREILSPERVAEIRGDVAYRAFDLREEADADQHLMHGLYEEVVPAFEAGTLRPLPTHVCPLEGAGDAFRHMARAEHVGKIVLVPPRGAGPLDGWAVVSGGTGALGLATVRWLLERGRRRIAVFTRRGAGESRKAEYAALEKRFGARLRDLRVNVAEGMPVRDALAALRSEAPVTMVIHAAGVMADSLLAGIDRETALSVMAPKIAGAWNLHVETRSDPVESFLLYSAAGPHIDAAGLGAYAAANAFLDSLAVQRRGLGLAGTSVLWGPWEEDGMAARLEERHRRRWTDMGLRGWTADRAFEVLDALVETTPPQVFAVRLGQKRSASPSDAPRARPAALVEEIGAMPAQKRRSALIDLVRAEVGKLLGTRERLFADMPLRDAGLDSLGAIELRNALTLAAGESLPATLAFDYPTIDAIASYLLTRLCLDDGSAAPEPVTPATSVEAELAALDDLSDEEAEALLLLELEEDVAGDGGVR